MVKTLKKIFPWTGLVVLQSANIPILIDVWLHGLIVPLAASVPMALDVGIRDGRIKPGQLVLMEAFGGGFTWGSVLMRL